MEGGRYRRSWLVACCMLDSAERLQSRGAERKKVEVVETCGFRESLMTKARVTVRVFPRDVA